MPAPRAPAAASPTALREPPPKPAAASASLAPAAIPAVASPPAVAQTDAALQLTVASSIDAGARKTAKAQLPADEDSKLITEKMAAWAAAWSSGRFDSYAKFYAPSFVPADGASRSDWAKQREMRLSRNSGINVEVRDVRLRMASSGGLVAEFVQQYRSDAFRDTTRKLLQWVKVGDEWLIDREIVGGGDGAGSRRSRAGR